MGEHLLCDANSGHLFYGSDSGHLLWKLTYEELRYIDFQVNSGTYWGPGSNRVFFENNPTKQQAGAALRALPIEWGRGTRSNIVELQLENPYSSAWTDCGITTNLLSADDFNLIRQTMTRYDRLEWTGLSSASGYNCRGVAAVTELRPEDLPGSITSYSDLVSLGGVDVGPGETGTIDLSDYDPTLQLHIVEWPLEFEVPFVDPEGHYFTYGMTNRRLYYWARKTT